MRVWERPYVRRGAASLLLLAVLLGLASSDRLHGMIGAAVAWGEPIVAAQSFLGMVVFVLLSALSAMLVFFSSALLVPLALQAWGAWVTFLLLWLGWLLGGLLSYSVGRYPGRRLLRWALTPQKVEGFEARLRQNAHFAFVLLFQMALPSEIPGYVLGTIRYPLRRYLVALALGELPFVLGVVYLGDGFLQRDYVLLAAVGGVGVLFSVVVSVLFYRRFTAGQGPSSRLGGAGGLR